MRQDQAEEIEDVDTNEAPRERNETFFGCSWCCRVYAKMTAVFAGMEAAVRAVSRHGGRGGRRAIADRGGSRRALARTLVRRGYL